MKKRMIILALALVCLCGAASANSWGLKGRLYQAVEKARLWDDYTSIGNQAGEFAVMGARYHSALFFADEEDRLHVYTAAVYQPEDQKKDVKLTLQDGMLTISYGKDESYTFCDTGEWYELYGATVGDFHVEMLTDEEGWDWRYSAADEEETVVFPVTITLDTFNIKRFPHSAAEVRNLNAMHALFDSSDRCLGNPDDAESYSPDHPGILLQPKQKGTAPVYSAPDIKSWRAGKGKAAVSTNGDMWVLGRYIGRDGKTWACIRYDVSERTQRIGWTPCGDIGLSETAQDKALLSFVNVPVQTVSETFLTDDPDVSQFAQFTLKKGTKLTCLGLYNDDYACVVSGSIAGKGTPVWGFVPVKALESAEQKVRKDVMKQTAGTWYVEAGGSMAGDMLILNTDGTFVSGSSGSPDEDPVELEGIWSVTGHDPSDGLYWDEPPYRLSLFFRNGSARFCGLSLTENHLNLTGGEGGGSYSRTDFTQEMYEDE